MKLKRVVLVQGGREVDDFVKYLKDHATTKFKTEL